MLAQRMPSQDGEGGEWIKRVKGKQRVVLHRHVSTCHLSEERWET